MKTFRCLEIVVVLLLAFGGVWLLITRPLDDRLDAMLPQDPALLQAMRVLEDAKLSGRVIVHVQAEAPGFEHENFVATLDQLAADLQSPLISQIVTPAATMPTPEDMKELAAFAPQLLAPETYSSLEQRISPEGIHQALSAIRRTMMSPHSMPMGEWFRRDPLGARATALKPLESLGKAIGFKATISDGHFFSEDQQAAMLILETPIRITDHAGSLELVAHIRSCLTRLPDGLKGSIIAGHLHTLSNQRLIRRDIGWTSTLAALFFGTLFMVYYRDVRSAFIFIIPTLGILMGLAIVGLTGARIAAIIVGMSCMLAGIAIDYGIHVYVALSHPETGRTREEAVRMIQRSLWISALTTIMPIAALAFSTIPGYRQLGLLASASILFSLWLATRIMPLLFPKNLTAAPAPRAPAAARPEPPPARALLLYLACMAAALTTAMGLRVDLDFASMDGTEPDIIQDEKAFFEHWGAGPSSMGIVAAWASDPEIARQANDAIYRHVAALPETSNSFFSLAVIHPSEKTRRANAARWLEFWDRHEPAARKELAAIGPSLGFATNAFDPFFDALREGTDPAVFPTNNHLLAMLEQQFARDNGDRFILLSFYRESPAMTAALAGLHDLPAPHAQVSRSELQASFADCIIRDLSRQALVGLVLAGILVVVLVRQARSILLIAIPPISGVVGMLAGLRIAGQPLTPIAMMAGLLMVGICFDYGVFMLEAWKRNARTEIGHGVYLAWITTAGGAALLLVARHPVLHAMGLALAVGVTCGYAAARWVIWPAARMLRVPVTPRGPA